MNYAGLSIPLHKNSYFPRIEHEQDAAERKKRPRPRVAGSRKHQLFSLTGISVTDATWITIQPCESLNPELREQYIQSKTEFVAGMPLPMTIPPSSPQAAYHNLVTAPVSICSISACK